MRNLKNYFLTLMFLPILVSDLSGQNIWRNTTIVAGAALGEQDRRLFDFPSAERLLAREPKRLDYDLACYLEKRVLRYKIFELNAGIGYSETNTLFGRPFDHSALNGGYTKELRHIKKYTINKLILPVANKIYIKNFYLQIVLLPTISFKKSAVDRNLNKVVTKRQFDWNSLEINPGIGIELWRRLQLSLNCRLLHFSEIDEVKFNDILFNEPYPEFLQKKADTHNPFKVWLTVGYKLKQ